MRKKHKKTLTRQNKRERRANIMSDTSKLVQHAEEETNGEDRACPICGNKEWDVGEEIYILSSSTSGSDSEVACAKCTNCGFVALFAEP